MFLPSQLVEISRRFQPDIEDLQVLLQEEGLPVGSAESLQELSTRLRSDARFRRDVAFLIRSMLGRERDEPGSMDVLGVLVVAAAGTRQEFDDPSQQQLMRELLRFVIQQRRPAAASSIAPDEGQAERRASIPAPISPRFATRQEQPSSADVPDPVAFPSLLRAEPEASSRRVLVGWIAAALVVLIAVGAGLLVRHSSSKAAAPGLARAVTAASVALPTHSAASEPEHDAVVPPSEQFRHASRKSSHSRSLAEPRHTQAPPASVPPIVAANTPPKSIESTEAALNGPKLSQPANSITALLARPPQESAAVPPPAEVVRTRSTPGSTDVSSLFAHPEAAAEGSQMPPPVFRPKDPVLIARNSPPSALVKPELQGTVHTASTGTMASSLMYSPEPEYPAQAIAAGVQGQVTVRAMVGPQGNVIDATIVSGPPLLRDAALNAVGRWRYRPYEQDGKPVAIETTAILDFQLPPRK